MTRREKAIARAGFHIGASGKFKPLKDQGDKAMKLFYETIELWVNIDHKKIKVNRKQKPR